MDRLVEVMISKVNILSILDCYYKLFPLIYQSYDLGGLTIQRPTGPIGAPQGEGPAVPAGSCDEHRILATTVIPQDSFNHYECKESMVLAVLYHVRKLGGRCISVKALKMDSWSVKNVFKFNNRVSYEAISSYMYKLLDHPGITTGISFEWYLASKKFLLCDEDPKGEVEVEVNEGVAMFKVEIHRISKFIVGEPGEPYCVIPVKCLKLLNKFLGTTINNSKIEFCKEDQNLLFLVDKEYYRTDVWLLTKVWLITRYIKIILLCSMLSNFYQKRNYFW